MMVASFTVRVDAHDALRIAKSRSVTHAARSDTDGCIIETRQLKTARRDLPAATHASWALKGFEKVIPSLTDRN